MNLKNVKKKDIGFVVMNNFCFKYFFLKMFVTKVLSLKYLGNLRALTVVLFKRYTLNYVIVIRLSLMYTKWLSIINFLLCILRTVCFTCLY